MNTNHENNGLVRLVNDLYAVQHDDILYDEAVVLMQRCADGLLSDEESQAQFPKLWRYFKLDPDSYDEYKMLMDLAQLEMAGQLSQPAYIPPMPTEEPTGIRRWFKGVKDVIRASFSGFTMQPSLVRRTRTHMLGFEPVEMEFEEGNLIITFELANDANSSTERPLRKLHCFVETEDEALEERLEFTPVCLQEASSGMLVQEGALNELGDVTFSSLPAGDYTFRLYLAGQEYVVEQLIIP